MIIIMSIVSDDKQAMLNSSLKYAKLFICQTMLKKLIRFSKILFLLF